MIKRSYDYRTLRIPNVKVYRQTDRQTADIFHSVLLCYCAIYRYRSFLMLDSQRLLKNNGTDDGMTNVRDKDTAKN